MTCSQDDLEAAAREELAFPAAQRVLGHVSGCAACARELALLHAELSLARREDEPVDRLWPALEARLHRPARRRALGVAAAAAIMVAAAAVAVALLPPRRLVQLALPEVPAPRVEPAPPPAPAPAPAPGPVPAGHLEPLQPGEAEGSARVRGPVELELVADGAALVVDRCKGRFVNLRTRDGAHREVRVVVAGRGRVRVELDGGAPLRGRAQLLVPRGSRVTVRGVAEIIDRSGGAVTIAR